MSEHIVERSLVPSKLGSFVHLLKEKGYSYWAVLKDCQGKKFTLSVSTMCWTETHKSLASEEVAVVFYAISEPMFKIGQTYVECKHELIGFGLGDFSESGVPGAFIAGTGPLHINDKTLLELWKTI